MDLELVVALVVLNECAILKYIWATLKVLGNSQISVQISEASIFVA